MAYEFKLPDIGEGVVEGEIVEWLVAEGDTVTEDQPLVAVMTDKATVEIPSPKAGKVVKLGAKAGEVVKVGAVLVAIETGGKDDGAGKAEAKEETGEKAAAKRGKEEPSKAAPAKADAKKEAEKPSSKETAKEPETKAAPKEEKPPAREEKKPEPKPREDRDEDDDSGRILASPATRRLARERGVDLADVEGSGPRGRVLAEDVEAAAESRKARRPKAAPNAREEEAAEARAIPRRAAEAGAREEERIPLRGLRKKIAERMSESKHEAAHFAYVDECDVTELVAMRGRLKGEAEKYGVKLTYLPFILKALVPCLRDNPLLNASLDKEAGEVVLKKYYNIGVATDTDRGLTVPVVQDVDRKSILEIAAEIAELTDRARAGRTKLEDVQGGTFTVTSTGNIGGLFATPIINYPEVGILGVPKIRQRPVVVDGQVVVRDILWLAISLDHRVVDGAVGARFMNQLISYLQEPSRLFLELA